MGLWTFFFEFLFDVCLHVFSFEDLVDFPIVFLLCWESFWEAKFVKMSMAHKRDAHFHKNAFSNSGTILGAVGRRFESYRPDQFSLNYA